MTGLFGGTPAVNVHRAEDGQNQKAPKEHDGGQIARREDMDG